MVLLGDFNHDMTATTKANPYTPINTWMKDYGLTNFA